MIFTNILFFTAIIYCLFENEAGKRNVNGFIFPDRTVPHLQRDRVSLTSSDRIKRDSAGDEVLINSESQEKIASVKHYQYIKNNLSISVRVSYVVNTRGNVHQLIATQTDVAENILNQQRIKKHNSLGFYSLFQDNDYAYLSSCLDSQGNTTVTSQQFSENLNQIKINPSLLGKWLVGKASIRDRRCLWFHLSVPLQSEVNNSHAVLENTWIDLVEWWSPNFPPL